VVITDKKIPYDDGTRWKYYTADVVSTQDYYAFGQGIDERGFSRGSSKYRYSYNGKETDDETGIQDYGFRMYDSRLCRFLSVDPLAEEYPWYTPYQFAGNKPIQCIDMDGLEPVSKATLGADAVAAKQGTDEYYSWTGVQNENTCEVYWKQGCSTMYQNGDVANSGSSDDNNKTYFPAVGVADLTVNIYTSLSKPGVKFFDPNNIDNRYNEWSDIFINGTKLEMPQCRREALYLRDKFVNGDPQYFTSYPPNSCMAHRLGTDPAFIKLAKSFEEQALAWYKNSGTMEGFTGSEILKNIGNPYVKDTWFMYIVMGGTQQVNAQIRIITDSEIHVQYTVWDHYGAGTDDATKSYLSGLPSLYWLKHNSTHFYPSTSSQYNPFIWNIKVNR
jgi:RHS repeat-associated protein